VDQPLIVGAGPVGLAAGLFLARQGRTTRIVELRGEPSTQSRALAVNPRTLTLLEPTGITEKMLAMGSPVRGMQFHRGNRVVVELSLGDVHPKYPFMLALSQATTEGLLSEALVAAGGSVERNIEMVECRNVGQRVEAVLQRAGGGEREAVDAPWLLAADGAHSTARRQMNIDFRGTTFDDVWYLADACLKTTLPSDRGHIFFYDDSAFLFVFPVINDKRTDDPSRPIWRILGNRPEPCSYLAAGELVDEPIWSSSFRVSHRIDAELSAGRVFFAGDAAHIHSPMGARGMNLGIEDAFVFAALAGQNRLAEYNALRHPVDARVVHQVEFFSRLMSQNSWYFDLIRRYVFPTLVKTPLQARIKQTVTGLDHDLPADLLSASKNCGAGLKSRDATETTTLCGSH
jgi:2-polyprenyl-6-methoxyphenol hydroxylase-like FAD-dependent oxidoreductase